MEDARPTWHDRLERRRYREAGLWQRRDRQRRWLDRDKELQADGALGALTLPNRGTVDMSTVACLVMSACMPAEVSMDATGAVMSVVIVVVQVRVQQRRTQCRQLEGGG
jgi:hypothetical protein